MKQVEDRRVLLCLLLLVLIGIIAMQCRPAYADTITGEIPLGGMSKVLSDFYDRGGSLYDQEDLALLAAAMQLENGNNSDRCLLLTGSVILNRAYYCDWAPDTIEGVLMQGYGTKGQQYATSTVQRLYTVQVTERVRKLAVELLVGGPICPKNVIYQAMFKQGSGVYEKVDTEYFCYE